MTTPIDLDDLLKLCESADAVSSECLCTDINCLFQRKANPDTVKRLVLAVKRMREDLEYIGQWGELQLTDMADVPERSRNCLKEVAELLGEPND